MESKENIVRKKSKKFAIRIVRLVQYMHRKHREFVLSNQVLRSGTSIGANIAESVYAISDKDFLNKLYIALKECSETQYWLEILYETDYINQNQYESISVDCIEILKILTAITKSKKSVVSGLEDNKVSEAY